MYSKALSIMDRNTVDYMIDELKKELRTEQLKNRKLEKENRRQAEESQRQVEELLVRLAKYEQAEKDKCGE